MIIYCHTVQCGGKRVKTFSLQTSQITSITCTSPWQANRWGDLVPFQKKAPFNSNLELFCTLKPKQNGDTVIRTHKCLYCKCLSKKRNQNLLVSLEMRLILNGLHQIPQDWMHETCFTHKEIGLVWWKFLECRK